MKLPIIRDDEGYVVEGVLLRKPIAAFENHAKIVDRFNNCSSLNCEYGSPSIRNEQYVTRLGFSLRFNTIIVSNICGTLTNLAAKEVDGNLEIWGKFTPAGEKADCAKYLLSTLENICLGARFIQKPDDLIADIVTWDVVTELDDVPNPRKNITLETICGIINPGSDC